MIEYHPLEPFLPKNGRMLFLGSFPPPQARWSMEWFYPNWINDFWRIMGLIHYGDKQHFEVEGQKRFDKGRIVQFCTEQGIAIFDTAQAVNRIKGNASDEFLEIVEQTDVLALLNQMPECHTIITTGGKASETLVAYFQRYGATVTVPKVGESTVIHIPNQYTLTWWRMPSSSRAYPMKVERKAMFYRSLFDNGRV